MSFDLKGIYSIDGRKAKKEIKEVEEAVKKSSETMSSYLENAFSGNLGSKLFGTAFKAAGLGAIAELATSMASEFQEKLKSIRIGSLRSGLDVETFQRVQTVTESQGASAEIAAKAMEHIAIAQDKIKKGEPEAKKLLEAFSALGVSLTDIDKSSFQTIFFKIAAGMKDAELTGERLAAVHELLGRTGAELIPSFKKGFDSPEASAGLIGEKELENFNKMNQQLKEADGLWKDMWKTVAELSAAVANSFRAIPILLRDISNGDFFKKFTSKGREDLEEERLENERLKSLREEQQKTLDARDAARSKKQLEERQASVQFAKDEEKAEKEVAHLENQFDEKERRNREEKLSKGERKSALKEDIEDQKAKLAVAKEAEDLAPNAQNEARRLQEAIRLSDLQHELFGLEKPHQTSTEQIHDSLARIGGGFASADRSIELLDQISKATQDTADIVRDMAMAGDGNPMSGN